MRDICKVHCGKKIMPFQQSWRHDLSHAPGKWIEYSKTSDSGSSEIGTVYNRSLYKGHCLRSQIFTLPIVLIHLQPPKRRQPLYKGQNKWIYIVPNMSLVLRFHCIRFWLCLECTNWCNIASFRGHSQFFNDAYWKCFQHASLKNILPALLFEWPGDEATRCNQQHQN